MAVVHLFLPGLFLASHFNLYAAVLRPPLSGGVHTPISAQQCCLLPCAPAKYPRQAEAPAPSGAEWPKAMIASQFMVSICVAGALLWLDERRAEVERRCCPQVDIHRRQSRRCRDMTRNTRVLFCGRLTGQSAGHRIELHSRSVLGNPKRTSALGFRNLFPVFRWRRWLLDVIGNEFHDCREPINPHASQGMLSACRAFEQAAHQPCRCNVVVCRREGVIACHGLSLQSRPGGSALGLVPCHSTRQAPSRRGLRS